jgi:hypothetical protein
MVPAVVPVWATVGDRRRRPRTVARQGLGKAEVEDLDPPVRGDLHVAGLEVAVDDTSLVGFLESLRYLPRDRDRFVHRDPAALEPLGEVLALHELHDEEVNPRSVGERGALGSVEVGDAGVVDGGEHPGLALEAGEPRGVEREGGGQDLERDVAAELRVGGAVDLSHPARADRGGHAIVAERAADQVCASNRDGGEPVRSEALFGHSTSAGRRRIARGAPRRGS